MGESTGTVKMSEDGMMTIPVATREVMGIDDKAVYLRVNDISVADIGDDVENREEILSHGSEIGGIVKMADDGMMILPIEVRRVLGIDGKSAYIRVNDIEVAKIIDNGGES